MSLFAPLDRIIVPSPDPDRAGWLRDWTYAHRGLHSPGIPENSLAGFELAAERGLGIECDIQRSRDNAAMLVHDWELERLTGISGRLADYSSDELAQIAFLDSEHKLARLDASSSTPKCTGSRQSPVRSKGSTRLAKKPMSSS